MYVSNIAAYGITEILSELYFLNKHKTGTYVTAMSCVLTFKKTT